MDTKICKKSAKKIARMADGLPDWQAETSIQAGIKDAKGHTVWAMRNFCSFRLPLLILLILLAMGSAALMVTHICRKRRRARREAIYCDCATAG